MVARGAQVRADEIVIISNYLADSFGPDIRVPDTGERQTGAAGTQESRSVGVAPQFLPEGPARALVLSSCTECHGLNKITEQRKAAPGWRASVKDMVRLGAGLKPEQVESVVSYLATNFGPRQEADGAPQAGGGAKPVDLSRMLPDGEGKGLILATCVQCHGLQEIVWQRKDADGWRRTVQDMVSRGAQITPEEAGLMASYLARSLGK
jgi:mono/diheme cytochrome c family protein